LTQEFNILQTANKTLVAVIVTNPHTQVATLQAQKLCSIYSPNNRRNKPRRTNI